MIPFSGRGILLDIEGTTSSVRFVYDVMFPAVREQLERFLAETWESPETRAACEVIANDAQYASVDDWFEVLQASADQTRQAMVRTEVLRLMDADAKVTGLKQLQGLIWQRGFENGELRAHVYDDVPPALQDWHRAGLDVRIYSSGSIQAQKLFFGHTEQGSLLAYFRGHYDTTTGPKREASSYSAIAKQFEFPAAEILFVSDVPAELDAARQAGMQTALCIRPGNAAVKSGHRHAELRSFAEIQIGRAER